MTDFASVQDVITLFRPLSPAEVSRATALLPAVSDALRQEAMNVGKDLDDMIASGLVLESVAKSVTVDVVARMLMAPTDDRGAMTQITESALGYSQGGTYLTPGGGLFIKRAELARLGLSRQRMTAVEMV